MSAFRHRGLIRPIVVLCKSTSSQWRSAFDWMDTYRQHDPDICDALLIATGLKVWTYDSEFATIWRALDGSLVPLAVKP